MNGFRAITFLVVIVTTFLSGRVPAQGQVVECDYDPKVDNLLGQSDLDAWLYWVEVLSGEKPAQLDGFPYSINTRDTRYMFTGSPEARAYDYVLQQVNNWFPNHAVTEQTFPYGGESAKNLIATIPGKTRPDEYVLLVAHLDDTSWTSSRMAPGANDNAIGAATLLEAARLFRQLEFERSVRLIWFTGEEAGTIGSRFYVAEYGDLDYRGVINLDMFGWDGDGDRCFEIHVGSLAGSDDIGRCMVESINNYDHNLTYDYLITGATGRSDHVNFWLNDIGAVAIIENASGIGTEGGCVDADMNPYYHTKDDTISLNLKPNYAYDIAQAALETTAALGKPIAEFTALISPTLEIKETIPGKVSLEWGVVPQAVSYKVFRSSFGCQDWGLKVAETTDINWTDEGLRLDWPYQYRIEAELADGITVSPPSNCIAVGPNTPPQYRFYYFPMILR